MPRASLHCAPGGVIVVRCVECHTPVATLGDVATARTVLPVLMTFGQTDAAIMQRLSHLLDTLNAQALCPTCRATKRAVVTPTREN